MKRLARFCFRQNLLYEKLGDDGAVTRSEQRQELVCHRDGVPLYRQLVVNGRPTGNREADPWPAIRDDENWRKQVRRAAEKTERFAEIIAEVPAAFDFSFQGRELVDGLQTVIYRLQPKPGYQARSTATEMLKHVTARAWVDPESAHMVRLQGRVEDDFNMWGGLLLKVRKGATYEMRQKPVNGTWLSVFTEERWHARVGVFKHLAQHLRIERSEFRPISQGAGK